MRHLPRCAIAIDLAALGIMLVFNACGGSGDDTLPDSGSDATMVDAPKEGATKDSSTTDAGHDSEADASDAGSDVTDGGFEDVVDENPVDSGTDGGLEASVTCGSMTGYGFVGSGDSGICGEGEDYSCGADMYQIECDCPTATCTCQKNGSPIGSMASYAGCPSCTSSPAFSTLAATCGIPY
jgi:hypothetical protein